MTDMNSVIEEMRTAHEAMKQYVDKRIDESKIGGESPETRESIEKVSLRLDQLNEQYNELRKIAQRPSVDIASMPKDEKSALQMRAFEKFIRYGSGERGRSIMDDSERRALSSISDTDGGVFVPVDFSNSIIKKAYDAAEIRPAAYVSTTGRDRVHLPSVANPTVAWGSANVAVSAQDLATGREFIDIHDLRALVLIHNNTLDDADADVFGEIGMLFPGAIAEAEDDAFAVGTGAGQPLGILADTRVQANKQAIGSDSLIDSAIKAMYKLKKSYRRNATWAFNSTTESLLRQQKDSVDGQYLWQPPVAAGAPPTLLGRPIINPEGIPDKDTNAYYAVIGDFSAGFWIKDRSGVTVQRLTERYAEYDQTGLIVKRRVGGQVVLPEAFVPMQG
jgi:HK97 family phage major capsid protein